MRKVLALFTLLVLAAIGLAAFQSGSTITGGGVRISGSASANDCMKYVSGNTIASAGAACGTGAGTVTGSSLTSGDVITGAGSSAIQASGTQLTALAPKASPTFTGTVTYPLVATTTNCAATGTAASPSLVACSAAPAGAFSCATNASAATCVISTTAVTANSRIFVQESAAEGANIGVTCNTAPSVVPAIFLSAKSAGTSFTINMPTIAANPACFVYWIVN